MKPWREGDPVGAGIVYLPDTKTKGAYAKACRSLFLDSAAQHVISLSKLEARRDFIRDYPAQAQEELKDRVRELWERQRVSDKSKFSRGKKRKLKKND